MSRSVAVEFISVNPEKILVGHNDDRRKVRIHVMKDFRRKERERQAARFKSKPLVTEVFSHTTQVPQHIRSPELVQVALTQKLRDGWFPVGSGFSTLVPAVVRSRAPVLAMLDAMKLVHLGSCVQDDRILLEGRKRFLLATSCLRSNLGHDLNIALPGLMLVSIGISMTEEVVLIFTSGEHVLRLTAHEIYNAILDASQPISWQKNIVGMSALLLKQRPIDGASPLEIFMVARLRTAQLLQSLCDRQAFPTEYAAPSLRWSSPAIDFLLDLAFRLPHLLASADYIMAGATHDAKTCQTGAHDLDKVVRDLVALRKMLDSWIDSFCRSAEHTKEENFLCVQQRTMRRSLSDVTSESLCHICLLLVHQTLSDLGSSYGSHFASQIRSQQLAEACAEDLYQDTMLLSKTTKGPVSRALATRAPLHFLCRYHESIGDHARLERCYGMIESLRTEAPYLNWEMLLPWSLVPLINVKREMPSYRPRDGNSTQ